MKRLEHGELLDTLRRVATRRRHMVVVGICCVAMVVLLIFGALVVAMPNLNLALKSSVNSVTWAFFTVASIGVYILVNNVVIGRNELILAGLISYVEGLRNYTVENFDVLRETNDAMNAVEVDPPPPAVERFDEHDSKALGTKERNTLLTIIGVLCGESGLDYGKHAKTAALIVSAADKQGIQIGETTIEQHLKKIPAAIAGRTR